MSNMKEINDTKIHEQNMEEKTIIANKIRYKKKSFENSPVFRTLRTDDKIKANPNIEEVNEITAKERSYRKSPKINSILSFSNDDWTLKESSNLEMKHEYENLGDHNEYNIFKLILAIIVLFFGKLVGIIYLIFAGFGIIDILLKIKNNSDIIFLF